MSNLNYKRSRKREISLRNELEEKGYYAIRAAGSKGLADIVAIKPAKCGNANHYEVRFLQVKVSEHFAKESKTMKVAKAACGLINLEFLKYPVKTKKWYAKRRKRLVNSKSKTRIQSRSAQR